MAMRKCKSCGRKQTNDPTALPKVVAAVNGYCVCWYEASDKLQEQLREMREKAVAAQAKQIDDLVMGTDLTLPETVAEQELVDYMEQVAPVHLPCNVEGCTLCKR